MPTTLLISCAIASGALQVHRKFYHFTENQLIDVMRLVNAAISGFIAAEQARLLTLNRSTDASFEVMLDALFVAIEQIQQVDS